MQWADDRVQSTFHRVRAPQLGSADAGRARFSIAYFNQAREGTLIAGVGGKYAPLTGRQFLERAIQRNFAALAAKRAAEAAEAA